MQPSVSSGSGNLKSVNGAPSAPPHSPSPAIRGGGDMDLRSRQPGGRQPGCTEQPVETALMFLFFVFSSGSWSQGRSKTRSQGFYWFNEVQSKGHWARRVGGETRGPRRIQSARFQRGAPAAQRPAKAPDPGEPTKSSRLPHWGPDKMASGRSSRANPQRGLRELSE